MEGSQKKLSIIEQNALKRIKEIEESPKLGLMKQIGILLDPLRAAKKEAFTLAFVALSMGVVGMIFTFIVKNIVQALVTNDIVTFYAYLGGVTLMGLYIVFITLYNKNRLVDFEEKIEYYLKEKYLKKFVLLENSYSESIGTGRFIEIISKGVDTYITLLETILVSYVITFTVLVGGLITVFIINNFLFYLFFGLVTTLLIVLTLLNKRLLKYRIYQKERDTEEIRILIRLLSSKFEILMNDKFDKELFKIKEISENITPYLYKIMAFIEGMFSSAKGIVWFLRVIVLYVAGIAIIKHHTSPGDLATLILSLAIIETTLNYFVDNYKNLLKSFPNVQRFYSIFNEDPNNTKYIQGYDTGDEFEFKRGDIELKDITFDYEGKHVFQNFSMALPGSSKIALIGRSGMGKTTLVKLISGYIRPKSGQILIDGQDLTQVTLKSYYKNIGYLTQETSIFDGTIRQNLLYGVDEDTITEEEIEDALDLAQCDFAYEFKDGLDTEIGERGIMLSGGQKQRLAIAKIFLKNPKLIILDEPTSALDSFSEKKITKAIHNLMKDRTIIIVAHRLQTVKECDKIYVIGKNKILEEGTHEELIKQNGSYSRMVDLQSGIIEE